jgi:hypothetical protein
MNVRPARVGEKGFDTSEKLTDAKIAALLAADPAISFAVRYVGLSLGVNPALDLDPIELAALHAHGLGVMAVQFARTGAWSAATGATDGANAKSNFAAAGLVAGTTLWMDFEGAVPSATVAEQYANAWWSSSGGAAMDSGVYVGPGIPLTSTELYQKLYTRRYWRAGAQVPNVESRGYQMQQLYPGNLIVGGQVIDYDYVQKDFLGSLPMLCIP